MCTASKRRKQRLLIGLLCVLLPVATACNNGGVPIRQETETTLPPAETDYEAPIGDANLDYTMDATLFLPRTDGTQLVSVTQSVAGSASRMDEESVVRALLAQEGSGVATALGGSVQLSLYGTNPVEVSGNVATVNLASSALQLDRKALYLCGQAIVNTLTEFDNIRYVNLLVMDKHIGLDIASTLPAGAFTRSVTSDVGAAYEQALSQRAGTDEDPASKSLSVTATLYFPLSAVNGVLAEARNITFESQEPADMVSRLVSELAEGPAALTGSPALTGLPSLLTQAPQVTDASDGGGKLVTLHFGPALDELLSQTGISRASCMGSLCYTLCTFLPNVTGFTAYIGSERVDHVMLGATTGLLFENGVQRRTTFASLLMDECTLYFINAENTALVAVKRPVSYYQRTNPRALLSELFKGPTAADSVQDTHSVLAAGMLSDSDILGLALEDNTLLVNLSATFVAAADGITAEQERLLAYSMVDTLLYEGQAKRISFFTAGETPAGITGEIYWAGYFYRNMRFADAQ